MSRKYSTLTEKIVNKKIQAINAVILLTNTTISAIAAVIPPIDTWFEENNIYTMLCYALATSIGLMVFSIFECVTNIKPPENSYKQLKELGKLLSQLDDERHVDIYFGLKDVNLLNQLIDFLTQHTSISSKYQIYVESCMIANINDENCFSLYNFNICYNLPKIILINANQNNFNEQSQLFFIRCTEDNEFEYISLNPDDEIMFTLTNNFLSQVKSIHISDLFISQAMKYIFDANCLAINNLIDNKCLEIYGRDAFFKYMTDLLKSFTSSVYAVDFIPPKFWIDDKYTREYGLAHKSLTSIVKQRIHIIDLERINLLNKSSKLKEIENYKKYASFMKNDCGVQLFFLELSKFDSIKYEKRGSLILDSECVFVAINPSDGAPIGEIDFNTQKINYYKERFDECIKAARPADDFINEILLKI